MIPPTHTQMRTFAAIVVATTVACTGASPTRLVPLADPFVYNGPAPITLPVQALTAAGVAVSVPIEASSETSTVAEATGERLRCLRAGDAVIRARTGSLRTSFVLQCRPIMSFGFTSLTLLSGGDAVPLSPVAYDSSGRLMRDLRMTASTEDTAIIGLRPGVVVPRRLGTAKVHLDFGGIATTTFVEVVAPVMRDTLQLAAGEYRSWALGPGRYVARIEVPRGTAPSAVTWRSVNANCALDSRSRAILHCVVADSGAVVAVAKAPAQVWVGIDRRAR